VNDSNDQSELYPDDQSNKLWNQENIDNSISVSNSDTLNWNNVSSIDRK